MSGTITVGNIPRLVQEGLRNIFGGSYREHPKEYDKIFDSFDSRKNFEVDQQLEGLGLAPEKPEGDEIAFDSFRQGFSPKYRHLTYGKGYIVSEEAIEDELYGQLKGKTRRLAFSMTQTKEVVGANILNRGFNGAFTQVDGDGEALFSTSHPNGPSGGVFSNKLAVDADFNEASLEDLLIVIGSARDPRDLQIALQGTKLIGPVALQFEFQRVLGSVLQNDTGNNATNAIRDMNSVRDGFTINHYLSDPDAWFIKTNSPDGLKYFTRRAVRFQEDNAFTSGNARMKADERYSFGFSDPRGAYATSGL